MSKKKAAWYCYGCLRKFHPAEVPKSGKCPYCSDELRCLKNKRTRAQTVTRLARHRGIRVKSRRKRDYYEVYLVSPEWRTIRKRILDRDSRICQDCGDHAALVHHLSYSRDVMAGKDDDQLVSLCFPCHDKRHPSKQTRRKLLVSGKQPQMAISEDATANRVCA